MAPDGPSAPPEAHADSGDGRTETPPDPDDGCQAPTGMGSPSTIAEAVELFNALPAPGTVPCFVQALDRPLAIRATKGRVSAQPADDARSPRIFLFSGPLTLSIVPAGIGSALLEFAEHSEGMAAYESLKGELRMPVAHPVTHDEPYGHLRYSENLTVCGLCHLDERPSDSVDHPNAYVSRALRPIGREIVSVDAMRAERAACDEAETPERCAVFGAIFDHGEVVERPFPPEMPTIFDSTD